MATNSTAPMSGELDSSKPEPSQSALAGVTERTVLGSNGGTPENTKSRADLIDLAVKFLSNPRVSSSPMEQKRSFLKKKGLTDVEIDQAIQMSSVPTQVVLPNQVPPPVPARASGRGWREYALGLVIVGGFGYTLYHFIKKHLLPWLREGSRSQQRLSDIQSSVEQLETNIRDMVTSVNDSNKALRDLLSEQQQHLQLLSSQVTSLQAGGGVAGSSVSMKEVKDEVSTLKGLLLNRNQFPPTPSRSNGTQSGIPQWQRAEASKPPAESNYSPDETAVPNGEHTEADDEDQEQ